MAHDRYFISSLTLRHVNAGQETVIENAHSVITHLTELVAYPHMMVCIFPHRTSFPVSDQALRAIARPCKYGHFQYVGFVLFM